MKSAFRVLSGTHEGLSDSWTVGMAQLSAGKITFKGREILPQAFKPVDPVTDADQLKGLRGRFSYEVDAEHYRLLTPAAELEWSIHNPPSGWAISTVFGQPLEAPDAP
ncbi:MAG: hypothetical protein WBA28_02660 [Microbacteriaceae bacterium]